MGEQELVVEGSRKGATKKTNKSTYIASTNIQVQGNLSIKDTLS